MSPLVSLILSLMSGFVSIMHVFLASSHKSNENRTDMFGKKYQRPYLVPGRICPECGFRAITQIPTCPSCKTKFLKG